MSDINVLEIKSRSRRVGGKHNEELKNDLLFVMIGCTPYTSILKNIGVEIAEDSLAPFRDSATMETNFKGVYAGRLNHFGEVQ